MKKINFRHFVLIVSVTLLAFSQLASAKEGNSKTHTNAACPAQKRGQSVAVQVSKFYDILDVASAMPTTAAPQKVERNPAEIKSAPSTSKKQASLPTHQKR